MTNKFNQSWELFKASIAVTLRHKKLLWFPFVTTALTSLIALIFLSAVLVPLVLHHTGYKLDQKQHWQALKDYYFQAPAMPPGAIKPAGAATGAVVATGADAAVATGASAGDNSSGKVVSTSRTFQVSHVWKSGLLFVIYFLSMFLATFFNVAYYSEIMAALNGKGVSFRRGFRTARDRLPAILVWSLLAGAVGWAIRSIEQRVPFAARIVAGLVGTAWSVAAVFAIPVIIREEPLRNPLVILKQSALTLKRTWGEGLIGYVGFSAAGAILFGISLVPLVVCFGLAMFLASAWLMVLAGALWVLALICLGYLSGVAGNVYRCALYLYATEGVVPEPYDQQMMDGAWRVKA
jgi:hypothetical protein